MILRVSFDTFAREARGRLGTDCAYLTQTSDCVLATAGDPMIDLTVASFTLFTIQQARIELEAQGLKVSDGCWALRPEELPVANDQTAYISAVSYRTRETKPGIWVDAYPQEPSPAEVLRRMYDEFRETGELGEVPFEEFMKLASPNVVVISPNEVRRYLAMKG